MLEPSSDIYLVPISRCLSSVLCSDLEFFKLDLIQSYQQSLLLHQQYKNNYHHFLWTFQIHELWIIECCTHFKGLRIVCQIFKTLYNCEFSDGADHVNFLQSEMSRSGPESCSDHQLFIPHFHQEIQGCTGLLNFQRQLCLKLLSYKELSPTVNMATRMRTYCNEHQKQKQIQKLTIRT